MHKGLKWEQLTAGLFYASWKKSKTTASVTGTHIHTIMFIETFGVTSPLHPGGARQQTPDLEIISSKKIIKVFRDRKLWRFVGAWHLSSGSDSWRWILTGKTCRNIRAVPMNFKGWWYWSCLCRSDGCSSCRLYELHNVTPSEWFIASWDLSDSCRMAPGAPAVCKILSVSSGCSDQLLK